MKELANELRLRGVVPWIDRDGGFDLGDETQEKARQAIRDDSFGLLLYATQHVFDRPFIRWVEIDEAKRMKESNPGFILVAIPRGIDFPQLQELSKDKLGIDLSGFYTIPVLEDADLAAVLRHVAMRTLRLVLQRAKGTVSEAKVLGVQVSTREVLPDDDADILRIDAVRILRSDTEEPMSWVRFLDALRDVKREIANQYGRPILRLHGSKHLTAAFIVGRVFAPFQLRIRQGRDYWDTAETTRPASESLDVQVQEGDPLSEVVSLEISATTKSVTPAVDRRILSGELQPRARIQLAPANESMVLDAETAVQIARQVRLQVERAVATWAISEIHLFAAVPQALMVMLGREFRALPTVQVYEYDGRQYRPSGRVPAGVL